MPKYLGLDGRALGLAISATCTCGFLLFGYDQGVMSGIITDEVFVNEFPETRDNSTMQGTITAVYDVGCLFGAILVLFVGDILGRRKSIMTGCTIMLLGVIIQVTSFRPHSALAQFIIGRIVTGIGNGMNTSTIPTYQAECSRTTNRGLLICIQGGSIAFGTLIAYWLNFGISYVRTDVLWRFPISFQSIFALLVLGSIIFLPESPRWLLSKNRHEEGTAVIAALHGESIDSAKTQLEKRIILDSIHVTTGSGAGGLGDLFTNGRTQHLRRVWLGASSQLMQQIGGCNAVIYYVPILFQTSMGLDRRMSLLLGGINATVYAISATGSWFVIETMGRRKLFLWGTVGQMVSMIIAFACLIPGSTSAAKGAAFGLFLYIASFGTSWLPLPWLYPAEINPLRTRTKANAVSTIFNWGFNTLVVMVTPIMVDRIGWGTYLFFAAVNACFIPFIYFFYPETRRRSLEEIDIIFAKGHSEKISYVRAAKELPSLSEEQIEDYAIRYGLIGIGQDSEAGVSEVPASGGRTPSSEADAKQVSLDVREHPEKSQ